MPFSNGQNVQIFPHPASPWDVAAPASNLPAIVTYGAQPGQDHLLNGVAWSYSGSGTLSGGNLSILDGATLVFSMDITAAGAGFMQFTSPITGSVGNALQITLAAGSSSVTGKVSVLGHQYIEVDTMSAADAPALEFNAARNSQYLPLLFGGAI